MRPSVQACYYVKTRHPQHALEAICRGQSIGNPTWRSQAETHAFQQQWAAQGTFYPVGDELYLMKIEWPLENFGQEGLNYCLSVFLGGQCDIDIIEQCYLAEVDIPDEATRFPGPRYGLKGIRQLLGIPRRPLLGGILKPKIGLTPAQLVERVTAMADGGIDFIKEDEILADQPWCSMRDRLPLVAKALASYSVLYAACITGDGSEVRQKAQQAKRYGATTLHLNIWCSLGAYHDVRQHVQLPLFFQKSGNQVWHRGPFALSPLVLYQLIRMAGCDFAHIGMLDGYLNESQADLTLRMAALKPAIPSFSCGMTPELAARIIDTFGRDLMVTSGGWIHSHPQGIGVAVRQFRRVVDAAGTS